MYQLQCETYFFNKTIPFPSNTAETRNNLGTGCTHSFCIYFIPRFGQCSFQNFKTWVEQSASLLFQNGPYPKVHQIEIRGKRVPEFLRPKGLEIVLTPSLDQFYCESGGPFCQRVTPSSPCKVFIHRTSISFNITRYTCWMILIPSSTKIKGVLRPLDVTLAHTITGDGFLSPEGCSTLNWYRLQSLCFSSKSNHSANYGLFEL